jgi:cell division septal protein FtsQ
MSPKRRLSKKPLVQGSVVDRLSQRRRRELRAGARRFLQVDPKSLQALAYGPSFRIAVAVLFGLALSLGSVASQPLIEHIQGDRASAAPVLVSSVAVQGNRRLSAESVALASGITRDSLASSLDTHTIVENLNSHPFIGSASAALLPTGQVLVRIVEREPMGLIRGPAVEGGESLWRLVDAEGTPFIEARAEQWSLLPRFRSAQPRATDEPDSLLVDALAIAAQLTDSPTQRAVHREIELPSKGAGRGWVLHSQTLPRTVILGEDELEPRLAKLAMLLGTDLPSTRGAEEIDLRFANQAVLRSRSSSQ